jgi:hypothetical protein
VTALSLRETAPSLRAPEPRLRIARLAVALGVAIAACDRPEAQATRTDAAAQAEHAPSAPLPATAAPAAADTVERWAGSYASEAGTLSLPPEIKATWKPTEVPSGLGDGTLAFTVDRASGQTIGTVEGPLGPATLAGVARDGKVSATVARRDPRDHGFVGTLVGTLGHDKGEGTMKLSPAEGGAIRSATFTVAPATRPDGAAR